MPAVPFGITLAATDWRAAAACRPGRQIEAFALNAELEIDRDTAENLEGLAVAAGMLGEHARAAGLWGAAAVFREANDQPWYPVERMVYKPLLDAARSQTGASIWDQAFAEGKAMGLEEAVAYALSEEKPVAPTPQVPDQPVAHARPPSLTRREEEVATLVGRRLTNRQIASELSISEHTAATHVSRILKKLGLQSWAQIVSWLTNR